MPDIKGHLRKTMLTGLFAFIPVVITGYIIWLIDQKTSIIPNKLFGTPIPLVGLVITVVIIYIIHTFQFIQCLDTRLRHFCLGCLSAETLYQTFFLFYF